MSTQKYSVEVIDDFIKLKTWGKLDIHELDAPANAALEMMKEKNLDKLLDDIREADASLVNIPMQTKSMGILWKLRAFRKVAIVMNDDLMHHLFAAALEALHLNDAKDVRFKSFDDEQEAIAWLKAS